MWLTWIEVDVVVKMSLLIVRVVLLNFSSRSGVEDKVDEGGEVVADGDKVVVYPIRLNVLV